MSINSLTLLPSEEGATVLSLCCWAGHCDCLEEYNEAEVSHESSKDDFSRARCFLLISFGKFAQRAFIWHGKSLPNLQHYVKDLW